MMLVKRALPFAIVFCASTAWAQQGHTVREVEPNETAATATPAAVGDTLSGVVSQTGDVDWFAVDIPTGSTLTFTPLAGTHALNIEFFDSDGRTGLVEQSADDPLAPLSYPITKGGRYFFQLTGREQGGSPSWLYSWAVTTQPLQLGPGDPIKMLAATMGQRWAVATPSSDFLVVTWFGGIKRISLDGTVSDFAALPTTYPNQATGGLALDDANNVLVAAVDSIQRKVVWRFSSTGQRSLFVALPASSDFDAPAAVTIGPDGDVWIGPSMRWRDTTSQRLWRTDASGNIKDTIDIRATHVRAAAFSPAGVLHFSADGGVFKLAGNAAVPVIPTDTQFSELAFDRDGYLYAIAGIGFDPGPSRKARQTHVVLFDPQYHAVSDPFARVPYAWSALLFARNRDGTMAKRLFAMQQLPGESRFAELNASGIRAPGWPLGKQSTTATISISDITNALMGGANLTAEQVQYLDSHGNRNGVLDVGDLRAYLRAQGQFSGNRRP